VTPPQYKLEFYEDDDGREPVLDWLRGLAPSKRRAIGVALFEILQYEARTSLARTSARGSAEGSSSSG